MKVYNDGGRAHVNGAKRPGFHLRFLYAIKFGCNGDVAECLRRSVSNLVRSTRVGSNPVVGTTNHKPTVNSAVYPSEVCK